MKYINHILIIFVLFLFSCNEDTWDEYYNSEPETVNVSVWDAMQEDESISTYVNYIKEFGYDTLFDKNDTYTLFAPDNDAFTEFLTSESVTNRVLEYLISLHFIQSGNIDGTRKIQTLGEKFATFARSGSSCTFDDVSLSFESPLYENGKYFIMSEVSLAKPNLYEYYEENNPVLQTYIDLQDSVGLDKEESTALGFDEEGNTIYDSVTIVVNLFEEEYFAVSEEFRGKTATIVFPKSDDYNNALTVMAQEMGIYSDYSEVPDDWQYDVLVPYLLERGVFANLLEEEDFVLDEDKYPLKDTLKMKNILGDSVVIEYTPCDKAICSNGYAYNYTDFIIPDTLYKTATRFEGESLTNSLGEDSYEWLEEVNVESDQSYDVIQEFVQTASNDSILKVSFTNGYTGKYTVEFNVDNLFPRKYLMVVRTRIYNGGIYNIYMNDELIKTFDYEDFEARYIVGVSGEYYIPENGYSKFDCFVENLTEYGTATLIFEYIEPGGVQKNGLNFDYIDFIPYEEEEE